MVSITDESILNLRHHQRESIGPTATRFYPQSSPDSEAVSFPTTICGPGFPQVPACMNGRGTAESKLTLKSQHFARKGPTPSEGPQHPGT